MEQIDSLLRESGLETAFLQSALEDWQGEASHPNLAQAQIRYQQRSRRALRCTLLRILLQEDFHGFSGSTPLS